MERRFFKYVNYTFTIALLTVSMAFFMSCSGNDGKVPADIVHNPISASGDQNMDQLPVMEFGETVHDFGTVIEGEKVIYSFKFKNAGRSELMLSSVSASCGCTATKYTRDPVPPGGEGVVTVTFDSRNRRGFQNKAVTIIANTQPNKTILRIKAKVVSPSEL